MIRPWSATSHTTVPSVVPQPQHAIAAAVEDAVGRDLADRHGEIGRPIGGKRRSVPSDEVRQSFSPPRSNANVAASAGGLDNGEPNSVAIRSLPSNCSLAWVPDAVAT